MLYIAELQELDRELNEWFRGPPSASSKHNTYMNKYFKFCAVTGVLKNYTGISFRKSGITALSRAAAANRLLMHHVADFADHQDIQTSRRYDEATLASRATFSDIIGAALTAEIPNM